MSDLDEVRALMAAASTDTVRELKVVRLSTARTILTRIKTDLERTAKALESMEAEMARGV